MRDLIWGEISAAAIALDMIANLYVKLQRGMEGLEPWDFFLGDNDFRTVCAELSNRKRKLKTRKLRRNSLSDSADILSYRQPQPQVHFAPQGLPRTVHEPHPILNELENLQPNPFSQS
jgi:hypothetical protein